MSLITTLSRAANSDILYQDTPPRPNAKRFSVMRLQCSPRHSLPALFSLAKSFLVIIRAKS